VNRDAKQQSGDTRQMRTEYSVHLNFLPFVDALPEFALYRKIKADPQEQRPGEGDIPTYSLPRDPSDTEDRGMYWLSFEQRDGFHQSRISSDFNHALTKWVLYRCLRRSAESRLSAKDLVVPRRGFIKEVRFPLRTHHEGREELVVQPYFLRVTRSFGLLVDFHFCLADGVQFSRRVQQLSLSLDKSFRRNLDYYVDRISKIKEFVRERWDVLGAVTLPGADSRITLSDRFMAVEADRLRSRVYVFGDGQESRSQFNGLRDHGPLKAPPSMPVLLFVFLEQDRQAARKLAMALKGSRQRERFSFPGFEPLFKTELQIHGDPVVVPDFSAASAKQVLNRTSSTSDLTVPLFVLPGRTSPGYLEHKAIFAKEGIATQVCTLPIILDDNALRWSVANIALQIFCKAGGSPWKVRATTTDRSLIIGISQSHKVHRMEDHAGVDKYFAFSVLTDNSGLFQKIQVLGQGEDESTYLENLRSNLRDVLKENTTRFARIVIHTSFRLRRREIDAIQEVAREIASQSESAGCQFAVLKVNQRNRFFGANRDVNSLVPYEGTCVRLGYGEYLVWFEGIFPDKRTVTKAFPGPTHIEFLKISDEAQIFDSVLLQDLMNLSGANWRGFNAKSAPVSVFYCHLVADLVHDFHEEGLPMPGVEQLTPWFL